MIVCFNKSNKAKKINKIIALLFNQIIPATGFMQETWSSKHYHVNCPKYTESPWGRSELSFEGGGKSKEGSYFKVTHTDVFFISSAELSTIRERGRYFKRRS